MRDYLCGIHLTEGSKTGALNTSSPKLDRPFEVLPESGGVGLTPAFLEDANTLVDNIRDHLT